MYISRIIIQMFVQLFIFFIKIVGSIPFLHASIKLPYKYVISKIKAEFINEPEILDIFLISNIHKKDFTLGLSDLNFIIVTSNVQHPKITLKKFKMFINTNWIFKLVVNTNYIPILSKLEFETKSVNSYLLRNYHRESITWTSVLSGREHTIKLRSQDKFSISNYAIYNLERNLFNPYNNKTRRFRLKNIYRSIKSLHKVFPEKFDYSKIWLRQNNLVQKYPILNNSMFTKIVKRSWNIVATEPIKTHPTNTYSIKTTLPEELFKHLESIKALPFIDDIIWSPAIIKNKYQDDQEKIFMEVIVNQLVKRGRYSNNLENLIDGIKGFESENFKIKFKITTNKVAKLQLQSSFFSFPLESLYRQEMMSCFNNVLTNIKINKSDITLSSMHFFINQFMRFRSFEQQSSLIGSKFIKSLNLMYRYKLLAVYLQTGRFKFETCEHKIRVHLTPQFSELKWDHIVTENEWELIKAQLIYLLKQIHTELIKKDSSLNLLKL